MHDEVPLELDEVPQQKIPAAIEVEQAVIGAAIKDPVAATTAAAMLRPEHFYRSQHQKIFSAICGLVENGEAVDYSTVVGELDRRGQLGAVGGRVGALFECADSIFTSANIEQHSRIVLEKASLRRLIALADATRHSCTNGYGTLSDLLAETQTQLLNISADSQVGDKGIVVWDDMALQVNELLDDVANKRKTGICRTGISDLDRRIGALRAGQLITIGGRARMGKTAFAVSLILNVCKRERVPTAMFSLEMQSQDIALRIACAEAGVSFHKAINSPLSNEENFSIQEAQGRLYGMPFTLDEAPGLNINRLVGRSQNLIRKKKVQVIIVDYVQIVPGPKSAQNREQEVSAVIRTLKAVAKDNGVVVIALAQLSREAERRLKESEKRPVLTDLRETGAIEQESDVVIFPYRTIKYDDNDNEVYSAAPQPGEIIIGKQRNGPTGIVKAMWFPERMLWTGQSQYDEA